MRNKQFFVILFILLSITIFFLAFGYIQGYSANIDKKTNLRDSQNSSGMHSKEGVVNNSKLRENRREYPKAQRYVSIYAEGEPRDWMPENDSLIRNTTAGTVEVTRYPGAKPTEGDLNAAWELYNRSFETAKQKGWFDFEEAKRDGYRMGVSRHWVNVENVSIYTGSSTLDPSNPEYLVYYKDPRNSDKYILAGYMYEKPIFGTEKNGSQIAGLLSVWHYHPMGDVGVERYRRYLEMYLSNNESANKINEIFRNYETGYENFREFAEESTRSPDMIHVWFVKHPEGPLGTTMGVPPEYLKSPEKMSESRFKKRILEKHQKKAPD